MRIEDKDILAIDEALARLRAFTGLTARRVAPTITNLEDLRQRLIDSLLAQAQDDILNRFGGKPVSLRLVIDPRNQMRGYDILGSDLTDELFYNPVTQEMRIHFKTSKRTWSYLNVSQELFDTVRYGTGFGGSVGKAYNALIKGEENLEPAPVVDGRRQEFPTWTVRFSYTSNVDGRAYERLVVVKAESRTEATEIARGKFRRKVPHSMGVVIQDIRQGRFGYSNQQDFAFFGEGRIISID